MTGTARTAVAGEVPNPLDPPAGCAFHPRCPYANDRCRTERPALRRAGAGLVACHAVEEGRIDVARSRRPAPMAPWHGNARGSAIIRAFADRPRSVPDEQPRPRDACTGPAAPPAIPPVRLLQVRLTQIKLAGFKSFVDPTAIAHAGPARRHRRPERLRQVERHRRRALGARRIEGLGAARRVDAGRHLQRRRRAQGRRPRVGRAHLRQQRRAASAASGASTPSCRSSAC